MRLATLLSTAILPAILMASPVAFSQVSSKTKASAAEATGSASAGKQTPSDTEKSASPSPTPAPLPGLVPTGKLPTHAEDVTIPPLPNAWSFFVYLQGVENGSGLGLGFETPKTWDFLNARLSVISDRYRDRTPANQDLDFLTVQAAAKFYLAPRASRGIGPYALAGLNHHFIREETNGSKTGVELLFGIEFNQLVADNTESQVAQQAAFVELGTTYAGVTTQPSGVRLRDGYIARLGFKTYF